MPNKSLYRSQRFINTDWIQCKEPSRKQVALCIEQFHQWVNFPKCDKFPTLKQTSVLNFSFGIPNRIHSIGLLGQIACASLASYYSPRVTHCRIFPHRICVFVREKESKRRFICSFFVCVVFFFFCDKARDICRYKYTNSIW